MKRLTLTILMSAAFLGMDARTNESVFEYGNNQKDAQEFPVLKQAEPEKIDRRILSIHVTADNNNTSVKARFPVSMVNTMLSNGLLAKLLFDTDDDDDADEKAEVEKTLQMLRSFIEEGVTGPLMQINTSGTHVSIEVIEYES